MYCLFYKLFQMVYVDYMALNKSGHGRDTIDMHEKRYEFYVRCHPCFLFCFVILCEKSSFCHSYNFSSEATF